MGVVLEDIESHRITGLVFATFNPNYRRKMVMNHPLLFISRIIWGFLTSSKIRKEVFHRLLPDNNSAKTSNSNLHTQLPPCDGPKAYYFLVGLHEDYRGGGHADNLVNYFVKRLFETGASRIWGKIDVTNPASLILHKRTGFKVKKISTRKFIIWLDRKNFSQEDQEL